MTEKRIVYLDDDEDASASLGEVLKEINYKVEFAKTASGAEKLFSKFSPDMLIVSMDITNSDPSDLIAKIKKNKELKKTPCIFLSKTFEEESFFEEFKDATRESSKFIKKPFQTEDFIDLVESTIGLPTPPKGIFPVSIGAQRDLITYRKENEELKAELSELREKIAENSKEAVAEKTAYIKEIQKDLDRFKEEKVVLHEECSLLKKDLFQKNKEIEEKEKRISEIKGERSSIKLELDELKKEVEGEKDKHKKAQNALREFYKPKLANLTKLEDKISELGLELEEKDRQVKKEKSLKEKLKKALEDVGMD